MGTLDLAGLSARLWSSGWELRYQPDAAAVRVHPPAAAGASVGRRYQMACLHVPPSSITAHGAVCCRGTNWGRVR